MNNVNNPLARQKGLVVQEMPNEVLVYDLDANKAHCLNDSASLIWKACDGTNSVADIITKLNSGGTNGINEDFVWLALDQLAENDLLAENVPPRRFNSRSRREVIKTIGLASVAAVPLIASLVAPPNALGAVSCNCTVPSDCLSMTGCPNLTFCNGFGLCANTPSVP